MNAIKNIIADYKNRIESEYNNESVEFELLNIDIIKAKNEVKKIECLVDYYFNIAEEEGGIDFDILTDLMNSINNI